MAQLPWLADKLVTGVKYIIGGQTVLHAVKNPVLEWRLKLVMKEL